LQHDCASSGCNKFASVNIQQERTETTKTKQSIVHKETGRFVLNAYSLHNYSLISQVIPAPLRMAMSVPYLPNSRQVQLNAARAIRMKKASETEPIGADIPEPSSAPPAFERTSRSLKQGLGRKGKNAQALNVKDAGPSVQPPTHPLVAHQIVPTVYSASLAPSAWPSVQPPSHSAPHQTVPMYWQYLVPTYHHDRRT